MVYTYRDNKDIVLVIKDADKVDGLNAVIGNIIMAATGEKPVAVGETEAAPVKEEAPALPMINSDEDFAKVSADFANGRYNGPLRKEIGSRLNIYMKERFDSSLKDENNRTVFISTLSENELKTLIKNFASVIRQKNFMAGFKRKYGESDRVDMKKIVDYLIMILTSC